MKTDKTKDAFDRYLLDGNVQFALGSICSNAEQVKIAQALLYDCFVAGSQYATSRCEAEHGGPTP